MMNQRPLLILYFVVATELIGFGLVIPILPQIGLQFASSNLMLSGLVAAYSASQFIASPVLGALSDRYGRKPVLVASKIGSLLGYLLFGFSTNFTMMHNLLINMFSKTQTDNSISSMVDGVVVISANWIQTLLHWFPSPMDHWYKRLHPKDM